MSVFKNILIFIAAAAIFFTTATAVLFVIKNGENDFTDLFVNVGDGKFILLGEEISVNKTVVEGINAHLKLCRDFSALIFPDYFSTPAKNAAVLTGTAAAEIVTDLYLIASDFVFGNM